jgi:hypothetical protein
MRRTSRSAAVAPADPSTGTRTLAARRGGPYTEPVRGRSDGITRTGRKPTWITFVVTDPVTRLPTAPAPCDPIAIIAISSI